MKNEKVWETKFIAPDELPIKQSPIPVAATANLSSHSGHVTKQKRVCVWAHTHV